MAVGKTADETLLNELASNLAQQFARTAQDSVLLATYVESIGTEGLGVAGFGTDDATAYEAAVNYLKTVALVFQGGATVPDAFNFGSALAQFVGPATTV